MNKLVKIIFLFSLFLSAALSSFTQQNHFIYLQTENKQPFYIKLDKKLLSSSASGYLIIPRLQDGDYSLTVGFPKNEWPEQKVKCTINKKDAGYLIKNFGDKGWGLFNLQTMEVVLSISRAVESKKDDLSATVPTVVPDTSNTKNAQEKPKLKEEIKSMVEITKKEEPVKLTNQIVKLLSNSNSEGKEMVYLDRANTIPDTIRVFIPAEDVFPIIQTEKKGPAPIVNTQKDSPDIKVEKSGDIEMPKQKAKADTFSTQPVLEVVPEKKIEVVQVPEKAKENVVRPVIVNSDCKNFATEEDFLKLRKKMTAEKNDDDMVSVAKKTFRSRCFTTEQIKNLCVLFLNDSGKYNFFDAAYPFVSDTYNFSSLQTQLRDIYFITRFKAMIRH